MATFIKSGNSTFKTMRNVIIALLPVILFSVYKNGVIPYMNDKIGFLNIFYPILFLLIGSLTSFILEAIYCVIFKKNILNSYAFFPGLFLALILNINTPILTLVIGSAIAAIFGKIIFKGFGKNIFNPALLGYVSLLILSNFGILDLGNPKNLYEVDTVSKSTPLSNQLMEVAGYDELVSPYGGLSNLLFGFVPGALAEVSSLLIIIGFIYLVWTKSIKYNITISYLSTVFILMLISGLIMGQGMYYPLFHILSGGLLFGAVFMATDPVTSSVTPVGQILQGILLGILTCIFRNYSAEGVAYSIIIVNGLVFFIDKIGVSARFNKIYLYVPFIIVLIFGVGISTCFGISKREILNSYSESVFPVGYNVISESIVDDGVIYRVSQRGYHGNIIANITIVNDIIISIEVTDNSEAAAKFQLIVDAEYINSLVENQDDLSLVDTISSATVTSQSIKDMVINTLDYHRN